MLPWHLPSSSTISGIRQVALRYLSRGPQWRGPVDLGSGQRKISRAEPARVAVSSGSTPPAATIGLACSPWSVVCMEVCDAVRLLHAKHGY